MQIMYFTERPYKDVPEDEVLRNRSFFGISNSYYDPRVGARLYNEYIDHAIYAEEMGFDAIMLNEHHGTPYCMGAVMNVEAAILARVTKKVRIVLLGNSLPRVLHGIHACALYSTYQCQTGKRAAHPGFKSVVAQLS